MNIVHIIMFFTYLTIGAMVVEIVWSMVKSYHQDKQRTIERLKELDSDVKQYQQSNKNRFNW